MTSISYAEVASSRCLVYSQDFYEGNLAEVAQGISRCLVVAAEEVNIKDILPGPSAHRPRLDLAEANIAQGEHAQGPEQGSGLVLHLERDGCFIRAPRNQPTMKFGGCR